MTKRLEGVEIFSVGNWNGDAYSIEDLDEMVRAFNENKATLKAPLKLGHSENQELLQRDGYPAAGWADRVYRVGEKLVADFSDIPGKIYDLLVKGAYKKVSSEIYWDVELNGKQYRRALAGVALLGADMPAVGNLSDIIAMYIDCARSKKFYADEKNQPTLKTYTFEEGEEMPTKEEIEKQEIEAKAKEQELADLRKFKTEQEAKNKSDAERIAKLEADAQEARIEADVASFDAAPSLKPYIKALLGAEKKEYAFGDKKLSKKETIAEMLKLHSATSKVNTTEKTVEGDVIKQGADADAKIKDYMAKNKVSYGEAYRAVAKTISQ